MRYSYIFKFNAMLIRMWLLWRDVSRLILVVFVFLYRLLINSCFFLLGQQLYQKWRSLLRNLLRLLATWHNLFQHSLHSSSAISCCAHLLGFPWSSCVLLTLLSFLLNADGFAIHRERTKLHGDRPPFCTTVWYVTVHCSACLHFYCSLWEDLHRQIFQVLCFHSDSTTVRLAQLGEHRSAERDTAGSPPGRNKSQGLKITK